MGFGRRIRIVGTAPAEWRTALRRRLRQAGHAIVDDADPTADAMILLELDPTAVEAQDFATTDEDGWERLAEAPSRRTVPVLQESRRALGVVDSMIVVLVQPATALEGAAGMVAATTGWEAQRALVKSAARRWGADGWRAGIVLVAPDSIGHAPEDALRTARTSSADLDAAHDSILLLMRPEASALNGTTIAADGGALMLP